MCTTAEPAKFKVGDLVELNAAGRKVHGCAIKETITAMNADVIFLGKYRFIAHADWLRHVPTTAKAEAR